MSIEPRETRTLDALVAELPEKYNAQVNLPADQEIDPATVYPKYRVVRRTVTNEVIAK